MPTTTETNRRTTGRDTQFTNFRVEDEIGSQGPGEEPQDGDSGGSGCPCGCLTRILLPIVIAAAATFWLGLWSTDTFDFLPDFIPFVDGEESSEIERQLLTNFYLASGGENWDESANWLSDAPLGEWYGVTTGKGGWVVSLRLPDNELGGDIWPGLIWLGGLQHMDLSDNRLSGEIPITFHNLSSLSVLLLNDNELTGEVPATLAIIVPNLTKFDLSGNRLTGCIPEDFKAAPPGSPGRSGIEQLGLPFCGTTGQAEVARPTPTPGSTATVRQTSSPEPTAAPEPTPGQPTTVPVPTASPVPVASAEPVASPEPAATPSPTLPPKPANFRPADGSYDTDRDGLISIFNLEQLDAIRYDLDGNGYADTRDNAEAYADAYPDASCRDCNGYELARPLDFLDPDSYASAKVKPEWTAGEGWLPIGTSSHPFDANFRGNGYTISNLLINRSVVDAGLFGHMQGQIRDVGLLDVDVAAAENVGGLAGLNGGIVLASYVTGRVSGQIRVGGLVGVNRGGITRFGWTIASYSAATVSGVENVGGLVGWSDGNIETSYSTGRVMGDHSVGGLLGELSQFGGEVVDSYWDVESSGLSSGIGRGDDSGVEEKTTAELQSPTGYTGIFSAWKADWDHADSHRYSYNGYTGIDHYWDFRSESEYPVLKVRDTLEVCEEFRIPAASFASKETATGGADGSYDTDGDGLIEVLDLEQLDAIRYDLDGDGEPDNDDDAESYAAAFSDYPAEGCPGCRGYELGSSLDFNDRGSYASSSINAEWTTDTGWEPIGRGDPKSEADRFEGVFDGNGNTISNLYIFLPDSGSSQDVHLGLFGVTGESSIIRNVGLVDVEVTASYSVSGSGGLTGLNLGMINASHVTGTVWGAGGQGGLAGLNLGYIVDSFSEATVTGGGGLVYMNHAAVCRSRAGGDVSGNVAGGLAAYNRGDIGYSHATGNVSGVTAGGLVGMSSGKISASYANGNVIGVEIGGLVGGGRGGAISFSYATGNVSAVTKSQAAGGLVGSMNAGQISASYAHGNVSGTEQVGGLVGQLGDNRREKSANIVASYATGSVSGENLVGGLVGFNAIDGKITHAYSTSSVSGVEAVGGLAGWNSGEMSDSYSSGRVTGIEMVGGLVGGNWEDTATLRNAHWDPGSSGRTTPVGSGESEGTEVKNAAEFQSPAGYTGIYSSWNAELDNADGDGNPFSGIDDFWEFGTARGYPVLKADLDGDGVGTSQEFGPQLKPDAGPLPERGPVQPAPTPTPPPQRSEVPGS